MRSVSSTPRCPSASSPARPGAERATSKVSCTCVGHVSTCPPALCLRRAGRHVRALQQRARVLQAVPGQVRAELPRPGHHHLHLHLVHLSSCHIIAGGEPAVREVRLLPRGAQLLLHPMLPGVHGPGPGQQVSQTGGMVTPSHPHNGHHNLTIFVFSVSEVQG